MKPFPIERTVGTSPVGATQTVRSPAGSRRVFHSVFVRYSGVATVNVTVTLNAGAGPEFDTLLGTIILTAQQDGVYTFPGGPLPLADGDTIDVFCPLLAAETSNVMIYNDPE